MKINFILTILTLASILSCKPHEGLIKKNLNSQQFYNGYETMNYEVLEKIEAIEIRQYQSSLIAEVEVDGDRKEASKRGFRILARYIFGKNIAKQKLGMTSPVSQIALEEEKSKSQKIDMTSPVIQEKLEETKWLVQFVMPKRFDLEVLPAPQDSRIRFRTIPAKKMIAITFDGRWTDENFQKNAVRLKEFITERNRKIESKIQIKFSGKPIFAYYDDPFTFPWNRRNEVLLEIR